MSWKRNGEPNEETWEVDPPHGFKHPSGNYMKSSCHHKNMHACGGCYARLITALQEIEARPEDAKRIIAGVRQALLAEGATNRLRGGH